MNPISRAVFCVVTVAFEVRARYWRVSDEGPPGLLDRLKRVLPFADVVAEDIVCEAIDLLEKIIPRKGDPALGRERVLRLRQTWYVVVLDLARC